MGWLIWGGAGVTLLGLAQAEQSAFGWLLLCVVCCCGLEMNMDVEIRKEGQPPFPFGCPHIDPTHRLAARMG